METIGYSKLSKGKKFLHNFARSWFQYLILGIFTILFAFPILWALMSSFKTSSEILNNPFGFPAKLQWTNYANAWIGADMGSYFLNSILITALGMIILIVLAVPTSYVLTRYEFKGRKILTVIMMAGLFINVNYIVYPLFMMFNTVSRTLFGDGLILTDNMATVALINAVTSVPFSIYLLSGFLVSLPKGYEEAARIDGCGNWGTMIKIVMPLMLPSILTVIMFQFLAYWNEYIVAQTFLVTPGKRTLPVGLLAIMEQAKTSTDYGRMYAGLVIVMLPVLVLYAFVQNNLTKGMTMGGLKG